MRKKLILSSFFILTGFIFLIVSSSNNNSQSHYQLKEFYQNFMQKPNQFDQQYITVYGNVKEGSITKSGVQANFIIIQDKKELAISFTGKTLLPDTLKDGSQAAVEGVYDQKNKIFIADKVMAKCASRYKSYPKN